MSVCACINERLVVIRCIYKIIYICKYIRQCVSNMRRLRKDKASCGEHLNGVSYVKPYCRSLKIRLRTQKYICILYAICVGRKSRTYDLYKMRQQTRWRCAPHLSATYIYYFIIHHAERVTFEFRGRVYIRLKNISARRNSCTLIFKYFTPVNLYLVV